MYTAAVAWLPPGMLLVVQDIIRRSLAIVAFTLPLLGTNRKRLRLSNSDLALDLETLAKQAGDLAGAVKSNGDFSPRMLAKLFGRGRPARQSAKELSRQLYPSKGRNHSAARRGHEATTTDSGRRPLGPRPAHQPGLLA